MSAMAHDELESLLWTILRNFESLALEKYQTYFPRLATSEKKDLVRQMSELAPDDRALDRSQLAGPVRELLACARQGEAASTLIVQGLVLERFGRILYDTLAKTGTLSPQTHALAVTGKAISGELSDLVPALVTQKMGDGEGLLECFTLDSREVLKRLDTLSEELDRAFAERFQVRFSDTVAEFAADLVQTCTAMGMNRKKLMCHLTACLMGV